MTKTKEKSPESLGQALTPRQVLFAEEYQVDFNGTQAAIRAGYSKKTAAEQASRLLKNVKIQALIAEGIKKRSKATGLTTQWVLDRLKETSDRCLQVVPVMEKRDGEWVDTGFFKFDSSGSNRSLELIGKHLKMFTDKVEVEGTLSLEQLMDASRKED